MTPQLMDSGSRLSPAEGRWTKATSSVRLALCSLAALLGVVPAPAHGMVGEAAPRSVLYVWAADEGLPLRVPSGNGAKTFNVPTRADFLAVVDADRESLTYGKVLHTVPVPTLPIGNEAHHVSPFVPEGCSTFVANGLVSDSWFTFDVSAPLRPRVLDTVGMLDTAGTAPGYAAPLPSCHVLGTETGGPLFGSHGTLVRIDATGRLVEERPGDRLPLDAGCDSQWAPGESLISGLVSTAPSRKGQTDECLPSGPLGIAVRPDLATLVTSDYAEPLPLVLPAPPSPGVTRFTVRHFPLDPTCTGRAAPPPGTRCIGDPRVAVLPDGPRRQPNERDEENVAVENVAVTHPAGRLNPTGDTPPGHLPSRGAFAATTCGGALYYTPDVSAASPEWLEVFDFSAAAEPLGPGERVPAACVGGGGLAVSPDNRFVFATIIGRDAGQKASPLGPVSDERPFPGMVVMLDAAQLVGSGAAFSCRIDATEEVWRGGAEADCPRVAGIHREVDPTTGGPHDVSLDHFEDGYRMAYTNYFVSQTGVDGDLRVCMLLIEGGRLRLDPKFPAAVDHQRPGTGCISFARSDWPAGRGARAGPAKPHHTMFLRVHQD